MQFLIDGNDKLGWNPAFKVEIGEDSVYLFSENEKKAYQGEEILLLAPLLIEGKFSAEELVQKLKNKVAAEAIYFNLIELEKKGLIHSKVKLDENFAAFCGLLKVDGKIAWKRLNETTVSLHSPDRMVLEEFSSLLKKMHIQIVDHHEHATISIVLVEDYLDPQIGDLQFSNSWVLLKPFGSTVWMGPLFGKKGGVCYQCLSQRIKYNRLEETLFVTDQCESFNAYATLNSTQNLGLSLMATDLLKWIVMGSNDKIENRIFTFNTLNLSGQEHQIVKQSNCLACGNQAVAKSPVIVLQRQKAKMEYRCSTPEEILEKFGHLVSPVTGIVRFLEPAPFVNGSVIHVYKSGVNNAIPHMAEKKNLNSFRTYCSGKGTSAMAAKAGSLCESLERFSGEYQGNEPVLLRSYQELGELAIHPASISLYSPEQYANRDKINSTCHNFNKIEAPLPEQLPISWSPIWSLTENRLKYVPFSYCYYLHSKFNEKWVGHANSNGCAAGSCLEEAILQGFFELVERDSVAIWWYNRLRYPQVSLESFHDTYIQNLLEEYARLGREAWVLDITSDLGIPTFVAISRMLHGPFEEIYMGFGSHLDAHLALLRALTEMNQLMGAPKFWDEKKHNESVQESIDREITASWMREANIDNQPYLKPEGILTAEHYKAWKCDDLFDAILECRKIVEDLGLEFLVLDQTRQDIGFNVVKVVVPGLRHFWARFAPGRLYDAPVKMGKLKAPLKELELNPITMFL